MPNNIRWNHVKPPFLGDDAMTVVIDLARYGLEEQEEEIWVESDSGSTVISSIPFCIDGLALFDRVELNPDAGMLSILERSGRGVFRVLVDQRIDTGEKWELASRLSDFFIGLELAHEWNGEGFVSVDVPSFYAAPEIQNGILNFKNVYGEWGVACVNSSDA